MGGASSFYAMLAISGFLSAVWMAGLLSRKLRVSSIVLEVAVGLIFGPGLLGLIPGELSECYDARNRDCETREWQIRIANKGYEFCDLQAYLDEDMYAKNKNWTHGFWGHTSTVALDGHDYHLDGSGSGDHRRLAGGKKGKTDFDSYEECLKESCSLDLALSCATVPDIFTLIGHTGVAMMIFESGMHFDFEQAKTVGPWACAVAILGTFLPIIFGAGLSLLYGFELMASLACGVSLAPTSVGIALKLLHEAKALQTYFGQAVMTAAFVDDVLSLVLFSILFSLGDNMTFMSFFPLVCGLVFMAVAIVACVAVWPKVIKFILSKVPETKPQAKVTRHDEVMWLLMFIVLVVYGQITHMCGTHLWGCFIAGMSFATDHHAHHVWVRQVKRITCWFIRIFFACTLAWSIPIDELFSLDAFWKGTIMGAIPCIATKVCCGPFMGKPRWVIGWAMVGRAEFAYFIGIMANSMKMIPDDLFAILVWSLIYATIFAPLIFRKVLANYMKSEGMAISLPEGIGAAGRISGHLPDLEQEEEDEREHKLHDEYDHMKEQLQEKDAEIQKIQSEARLSEKTGQDDPNLAQAKLIAEKDEKITQLEAMLAAKDKEMTEKSEAWGKERKVLETVAAVNAEAPNSTTHL